MPVRTHEMFEHADVPCKQRLTVGLEVSALSHLEPAAAPRVYRTLGEAYPRVYILPQFRSVIRGAAVNHEAKDLYTSGREVIARQIQDELHKMLRERGIVLEKVLLRKIVLPKMVEGSPLRRWDVAEAGALRSPSYLAPRRAKWIPRA